MRVAEIVGDNPVGGYAGILEKILLKLFGFGPLFVVESVGPLEDLGSGLFAFVRFFHYRNAMTEESAGNKLRQPPYSF